MKMRFLAASAVAVAGLIGAFTPGQATSVALAASVGPPGAAFNGSGTGFNGSGAGSTAGTFNGGRSGGKSGGTAVPDPTTTPTFSSNFSGSSLNTSIWGTCYPWFPDPATGCQNFGNSDELEWYLPSQDQLSGGDLNLVAQPEATQGYSSSGAAKTYNCRSGMVTTYPGFNFEYGIVQVVANIPQTYGLWSAIWLLPTSEGWPPEIDMEETWGPPDVQTAYTFHYADGDNDESTQASSASPLSPGWHTFTLDWTPTSLTWWLDGTEVLTTSSDIPSQSMYLLIDLADYAQTSTQGCSGTMQVKSVKIWEQS
jgi:beta-glucanase (GH16 family)